jgi:hypothetical protein
MDYLLQTWWYEPRCVSVLKQKKNFEGLLTSVEDNIRKYLKGTIVRAWDDMM